MKCGIFEAILVFTLVTTLTPACAQVPEIPDPNLPDIAMVRPFRGGVAIAFAALYIWRGSLRIPILIHAAVDAVLVLTV